MSRIRLGYSVAMSCASLDIDAKLLNHLRYLPLWTRWDHKACLPCGRRRMNPLQDLDEAEL